MTPERWSEIEKLFNEFAGRPPQEQAAKLANVEAELRREVEKLLASDGLSIPGVARALAEARVEVQERLSPSQSPNDGPTRFAAGTGWGFTRSSRPSAQAEWEKSIARTTGSSGATLL